MLRLLFVLLALFLLTGGAIYFYMNNKNFQKPPLEWLVDSFFVSDEKSNKKSIQNKKINYAAIGDSYTSGYGIEPGFAYPYMLTKHLNDEGFRAEIANFAVSGYTTQNVIDYQIPQLESSDANFVTILIGGNDIAQRLDAAIFQKQYKLLLDRAQKALPGEDMILLISLPDFSRTPYVVQIGYTEEEVQEEILKYNNIVKEEAKNRNLPFVDLYSKTGSLTNPDMILADGLHPTAKQYALWEKEIYPVAYNMVKHYE